MSLSTELRDRDDPDRIEHVLRMNVHPKDTEYVALKSGEVFCNPRYSERLAKDKETISATLTIVQAEASEELTASRMIYLPYFVMKTSPSPHRYNFVAFCQPLNSWTF
jgi:hypothetical protein